MAKRKRKQGPKKDGHAPYDSFKGEKAIDPFPEVINLYEKKPYTRGVLLFATGHAYYGECAVRLAASLKANDPDLLISVVTDAPAQIKSIDLHRELFDRLIAPDNAYLYQGAKRVDIRQKIFAYDISPYDETLMLDVDMLWLPKKKPSALFEELKDLDFTIQNTGYADLSKDNVDDQVYYYWAPISACKAAYGFKEGKFYQMTGELVYFKKTERVRQWFDVVREIYDNCKVTSIAEFANQKTTDELAYSIASVITGLYPHKDNWLPVYWPFRNDYLMRTIGTSYIDLAKTYYAMSVGGNELPGNYKEQYELLARGYHCKMKITLPAALRDKKKSIPERRLQ